MTLPIYRTITGALGFAWHKYETAARIAWFPLTLFFVASIAYVYLYLSLATGETVTIFNLSYLEAVRLFPAALSTLAQQQGVAMIWLIQISQFVLMVVLYTSFMIPLFRYAARDIEPTRRSIHFAFGFGQLRYIITQILVGLGIGVIAFVPMQIAIFYTTQAITNANQNPFAVFPNPDSLHTIELQERSTAVFDSMQWVAIVVFFLLFIYLNLRLFTLPAFVAVRQKGDTYNSFGKSLSVTRGWNVLRLFVVLLATAGVTYIVPLALTFLVFPFVGFVLFSLAAFLDSVTGLTSAGAGQEGSIGAFFLAYVVIVYILNMLYTILVFGIYAGLNGQLFKHSE